jgi:LPPG:FO 2-phospho-L-lactate transferase
MQDINRNKVLAISGGVGGAKLALGLARTLDPSRLTIVTNTADDFEHLGLYIAPDLDTVMYTLAGLNNQQAGWGLAGESWQFLETLAQLGGESWFRLGDKDLATHVYRSQRLAQGASLSTVTAELCARLGIGPDLLPMSEDPVRTMVLSEEGELAFQHYFVREQCRPVVTGFRFEGVETARPQPKVMALLADPSLSAIVLCPSNPFVSVDPILALPGLREAMINSPAPVCAVSPIVSGLAIKGPAAKMMSELGMPVTALAVAQHYQGLVDYFVLDDGDATLVAEIERLGIRVATTATIMKSLADRERLGRFVVELAAKGDL